MINILSLVSYPFLPARMGGEKAIAHFYRHLSAVVPLTCVTTKKNDPSAAQGYEVLNVLSNSPLRYANIFYYFRLRKIIRERKITHLLIEHPYYGWLAVLLKNFTGVKLIVRSHNIEGLRWKTLGKWWWKILLKYEGWTHRRADFNFFIQAEELQYAIKQFRLQPAKCLELPYGVEITDPLSEEERNEARRQLISLHGIPATNSILLFNGAFNYLPNMNALKTIIADVIPDLWQQKGFSFTLLVCGRGIPREFIERKYDHVIFAGFVEDIGLYYKGADIFLNPVIEGGGVKTKLVEALAHGMNTVSTENGAKGIDPAICGGKLVVVRETDMKQFATDIIRQTNFKARTPDAFFEHFSWRNIINKVVAFLRVQIN